jgi:hypothetical protein
MSGLRTGVTATDHDDPPPRTHGATDADCSTWNITRRDRQCSTWNIRKLWTHSNIFTRQYRLIFVLRPRPLSQETRGARP